MSLHSTRNVDMGKQESELAINIRKATSIGDRSQEYATQALSFPTRLNTTPGKHVRACIVYTYDHRSSQSFWAGMKV
ncbi:unnamed protein product [Aureobasidium mustum]|uniref:Uncharacterized protein n=1 Tax=Aureobasidium mustum TaxID=2773714 RepID=A0A9N8K2X0_9PEZI|nr:unnamed protein product [Aureobasidium mustum]